jgi:hypothetical protein
MQQFLRTLSIELPFLLILILCAGLIAFWQWAALQRRRMAHAERLAVLEKGAPMPTESETNGYSHRRPLTREAYMLRGLLWSAIGLGTVATGMTAALFVEPRSDREPALYLACLGFIPFALGLGYLLYARLTRQNRAS